MVLVPTPAQISSGISSTSPRHYREKAAAEAMTVHNAEDGELDGDVGGMLGYLQFSEDGGVAGEPVCESLTSV
ncbi:MAG: hypothetical protein QOE41_3327 [Mycobacterium sp.]|jgi:hypothetical protein|nr:hypothetical protein [Mycobacterium sp.]MDT5134016.1 hypothetical protein [Mycobacterium sp.]